MFIKFANMYGFAILALVIGEIERKTTGKILINLEPGENSLLSELKKGKTLLSWLLVSTANPLIFSLCLKVIFLSEIQWFLACSAYFLSRRDLMIWLLGSVDVLGCRCSLSFWRWRWIRTSSVIVSIPKKDKVWKAPRIHKMALCYIFLNYLSG